jgi:3-hydroxymyristoyl/3-hydroxydecanoyl-(acyl carrier protein) dehydratase
MNSATQWTVPLDHPVFTGHFPGTPILPGVMLLDTTLHAIAAATGMTLDICEISTVKFLSPAAPGDQLAILHHRSAGNTIRFDIMAGRRKIASGSITPKTPGRPL